MKKLLLIVPLLLIAAALQAQTIRYVKPGGTGDGSSWSNASGDLQAMIDASNAADQVWVAAGTYQQVNEYAFVMKNGVKIYGGFAGNETNLSQRNFASNTTTLQGNSCNVIINNNNNLDNTALLDGFVITGGYGYDDQTGTGIGQNYGAGIYNSGASPTIQNCIINHNHAYFYGGGVANINASPVFINVQITGNFTESGGGVYNSGGSPQFINVTIAGNRDDAGGGGVYNDNGSSPAFKNCIIYDNYGENSAGYSVEGDVLNTSGGAPVFTNSLLPSYAAPPYPVSTSWSNNFGTDGGNNIVGQDPGFVSPVAGSSAPSSSGNYSLIHGSPAVNAGSNSFLPAGDTLDLAGNPRKYGTADMGAYEFIPSVIYVDNSIATPGDGSGWSTAFKTLSDAIAFADQYSNVDSILIAKGTYYPPGSQNSADRDSAFLIPQRGGIKIYGGYPSGGGTRNIVLNPTILSGDIGTLNNNSDNSQHILVVTNTLPGADSVVIDGLTITNANGTTGQYTYNGNLTNQTEGGGILIRQNTGLNGKMAVRNCTIINNSNTSTGGGIYCWNASAVVSGCIISGNTSGNGGGMLNISNVANSTIINSVFANNSATNGGGLYNGNSASAVISNCTFSNNTASGSGNNIWNDNSTINLTNSIVWNGDMYNTATLNATYCDVQQTSGAYSGTGNINTDPLFVSSTDLHLQSTSPCINTGIADTTGLNVGNFDLDGNSRVQGGRIDMGAYEVFLSTPASLNFDGADDYVQIPNSISSASAFTIEYWMKTTQTGASGSQWFNGNGIVDAEMPGATNDFGTSLVGAKIAFGIGNPDKTILSASDVNTGNWVHVAVVWDGPAGTMNLYINGILEASSTSGVPAANRNAPSTITLGAINTLQNYYNGNIDELHIWNVARSQPDIQSDMNSFVSPATGLVASYAFDNGVPNADNTGITTITDSSGYHYNGTLHNFSLTGTSSNFTDNIVYPDITFPSVKQWYVKPGATGGGTGWDDAGDLQTMINNAGSGDSVFVAAGTYQPASGQSFVMKDGVKIYGGFQGTETNLAQRHLVVSDISVLEGNGNSVIDNTGNNLTAAAVLDGFSITGGNSSGNGGGMTNQNSSPTLTNLTFENNTAGNDGGGMCNSSSSPILTNVAFVNNSAPKSEEGGGGMCNIASSPTLTNVIFVGNSAKYGGGLQNYNSSSPTLTNVTFVGNSSRSSSGSGMDDLSHSSPTLTNCIFWGNTPSGTYPDIHQEDGSFTINYSYTQTAQSGTGNITGTTDPFINSANPAGADGIYGTADDGLQLAPGSTAVNAGSNAALPAGDTLDLVGNPRIVEDVVDMGAYESQGTALPVKLNSFNGALHNGIAQLQWNTGMENNFNHFEIEKSTDDSSFRPQGEISAKGSNSHYTCNAPQPEPTAYYRLKMVDNDGRATYSDIIRLSQSSNGGISIYPDPAKDHINVSVAKAGSISIYNASGKLVKTQALQAGINRIEVSALSTGIYYANVNGAKMKFIKE